MGLDCSHDAFHGAYSAFNRFRQAVCEATGGSFPPHENEAIDPNSWYWGDDYSENTHPGLFVFLAHEDCEGEISPDDCVVVAGELEALLPKLNELDGKYGGGHIASVGGLVDVCKKFIAGCRLAAQHEESLIFE